MEDSRYFFKTIGLESYMSHEKNFCESPAREDMDNLNYSSLVYPKVKVEESEKVEMEKEDMCDKQDAISDEVNQIMVKVEADDFFSSLELQSSSKIASNVLNLGFQSRGSGGIVTRSRTFSSTVHECPKGGEKVEPTSEPKRKTKKEATEGKKTKKVDKSRKRKRTNFRGKRTKKSSNEGKASGHPDPKRQNSVKVEDNLDKNSGTERSKDEDDWLFFHQLGSKKEAEDKLFENKNVLGTELNGSSKRFTPELFSMSPILMTDSIVEVKDDVDKLLEVEDYDDSFLEEMDEFETAPPRSHTGGKWKPGSLSIRISPMLWHTPNWENLLDERSQYEEGKSRLEPFIDSPTEGKDNKNSPVSSSGGKWKSNTPPSTYTGGKWKPLTPPATYTGGKWKPSETPQRNKKTEHDLLLPQDPDNQWKSESLSDNAPPVGHTGGKWKPNSCPAQSGDRYEDESPLRKTKSEHPPASHTRGKWVSESGKKSYGRATLDVLANCQSTSGKCLKTSGGTVQYYCSPCNRRLSSKKVFKNHIQSELHFKRVLQENDLEFDSRSLKLVRGLLTQVGHKERGSGKRIVKKPDSFKDTETNMFKRERKTLPAIKVKGKRVRRSEIIRCEVCKLKIPGYQLGKHLVSYYHSRRIQLTDPSQQKLVLGNIHTIVKQSPYQCDVCKFYCNTHSFFRRHWLLPVHEEAESTDRKFWCSLCTFECETARSMELHLDSNSHREVIQAVNGSIPIIIRHRHVFRCSICRKEFRFNRELIDHRRSRHEEAEGEVSDGSACSVCGYTCKSLKSLQRHIITCHKGDVRVPYFCSTCSQMFATKTEARTHRNGQLHKYKKALEEKGNTKQKGLSRRCPYCEEVAEDIEKLKSHLFQNHRQFLPKCIKCGMEFALSQEVSRHARSNQCDFAAKTERSTSFETFECDLCAFSTNSKSEFLLHTAIHQKKDKADKKIGCPLCGSQFTQSALGIHLRTHLKEMMYRCSMCPSAFVRKDRYVAHLKSKHFLRESTDVHPAKNEEPKAGLSEGKNKENSKEADKKKTETDQIKIRQICGDAKCKYVAKDAEDSESHRRIHVGPKVYQCPECPYHAKTNTIIKRHLMTHMDEKSFSCPHCPFKGRLKSHLKRHLRLHTGAKPYKCPHCSYSCNILENLRKHVMRTRIHPGKKLYECKLCTFGTNVSKEFKSHLVGEHKSERGPGVTIAAAGIYNKEEDLTNTTRPIPAKAKAVPRQSRAKVTSAAVKRKIDELTQKFYPIAPKVQCTDEKHETSHSKSPGNLVEHKRKVLEMELEKLRKQIKPRTNKILRSYPSPAEKDLKSRNTAGEEANAEVGKGDVFNKATTECKEEGSRQPVDPEGSDKLPMNVSSAPEGDTAQDITKNEIRQVDPFTVYVLYENSTSSKDSELYLLKDYDA